MRFIQARLHPNFPSPTSCDKPARLGFRRAAFVGCLGTDLSFGAVDGFHCGATSGDLGGGDHWRFLDSRYLKEGNI